MKKKQPKDLLQTHLNMCAKLVYNLKMYFPGYIKKSKEKNTRLKKNCLDLIAFNSMWFT